MSVTEKQEAVSSTVGDDPVKMEEEEEEDTTVYPKGIQFVMLMASFYLGVFMVSLDKLIVSTAIPQITNDFKSPDDIGWYGTAYLLTNAAFQLLFGKLYKFVPIKATFLGSILVFVVGSTVCAAAPNSIAFIIGRAIAGVGAGGVLSGVMVVLVFCVPLEQRPRMQGMAGAIFGVSSVLGPTLSGAFTTHATWRWCFWINLPMGAVTMAVVTFLLKIPDRLTTKVPLKEKIRQLNLLGFAALLPGVVSLCLALQWGGSKYQWSEWRVVLCLVMAAVLMVAFVLIQIWKPDQATVPPKIFMQRSIASGFWVSLCIGSHQTVFLYYLPLWFQAIKGSSAVESGTQILPMVLLIVIGFIANGELTTRTGYYTPSLIVGATLTALGAGLMTTFNVSTGKGMWVGYQILYGFGIGLAGQVPNMAAQTILPKDDVAIGASLMFFSQTLFAAIFTSVGQQVLSKELLKRLGDIPGITAQLIRSSGATEILKLVPKASHDLALNAYNASLRTVFQVGLILACIEILGAATMEWRKAKPKFPPKQKKGEESAADAGEKEAQSESAETLSAHASSPVEPVKSGDNRE